MVDSKQFATHRSVIEDLLDAICAPPGSVEKWSIALKASKQHVGKHLVDDQATIDRILVGCVPTPRTGEFADEGGSIAVWDVVLHGELNLAATLSIECATVACTSLFHCTSPFFTNQDEPETKPNGKPVIEEVEDDSFGIARTLLNTCGYMTSSTMLVPWADDSTDDRASQLIRCLCKIVPNDCRLCREAEGSDQARHFDATTANTNKLLLSRCLEAMRHAKTVLTCKINEDLDSAIQSAATGPSPFDRCVMAYCVLNYVCTMRTPDEASTNPYLSAAIPYLLPTLLAAFSDPSPLVKSCACISLSHILASTPPTSIIHHGEILTHSVTRALVGCDPTMWQYVLPCATQLMVSVGSHAECDALLRSLAGAILPQVSRHALDGPYRAVFLGQAGTFVGALGLGCVAYFSVMMPLLLEWLTLESMDGVVRIAEVFREIIRVAWPRMRAHASLLTRRLQEAVTRLDSKDLASNDSKIAALHEVQSVCDLLASIPSFTAS